MNRVITTNKVLKALGARLARNIYVWVIQLYLVLEINKANEQAHHHGIIYTRWYWWVIAIGMLLQMILVYVNNLLLIPALLARKKRVQYFVAVLALATTISIIYTIGLKVAKTHIDVDKLQQMGMVTGPISTDWSFRTVLDEMQTYLTGNAMWLFVFTMAWYMNDYARQRRLAEQALRQRTETELAFLKSQLNPHFLFNTLNNVYALTLKQAAEAPDSILKLSTILRYLLYESNSETVSFEKEKEIMLAYIDLELLRIKERDRLKFVITADRDYRIPPLLWLPLLENVFKHGTKIISKEIFVNYIFAINDNKLRISASNHYKQNGKEIGPGIGLTNLGKRLALLYPHKHTLTTAYKDHTFTTEVNIELA